VSKTVLEYEAVLSILGGVVLRLDIAVYPDRAVTALERSTPVAQTTRAAPPS